MKDKTGHKREFFRIDAVVPFIVNVAAPGNKDSSQPKAAETKDLKPGIINISGGGIAFKSAKEYTRGDILDITMSLPLLSNAVIRVSGEVLNSAKTVYNLHQVFVRFTGISERIREMIVSFVFQLEREILRNTQANQYAKFEAVPVHKFVEGAPIPFDVFVKDDNGIRFLFEAGLPFDGISQEFFLEKGITNIYAKKEDMPLLDDYLSKYRVKKKVFDREDILSFKEYSFNKMHYHRIDRAVLMPHTEINFTVIAAKDFTFSSFLEATPLKPVTLDENSLSGAENVLVRKADMPRLRTYLKNVPFQRKTASLILKEQAKVIIEELLEDPRSKERMAEAVAVSGKLTDCMIENKDAAHALLSPNSGDFYTAVHSVNVAVTCLRTGMALNLKREFLERLCIGALLHDIGHSVISDETIDKQGKLSSYEYETFKTHVAEGVKILREHDIPDESLNLVLHHHEKVNGRGYPSRLSGNEISLFGMIASIADSYDLLTTARPYRNAMPSFDALSTLARESKNFNPEILKLFIRIFSRVK